MTMPSWTGSFGETVNRVVATAELAAAQSAGGKMYIEPDKVDEVARFFSDEAEAMRKRARDIYELGTIAPPGTDPVSTQAAEKYGQVAVGGDQAYVSNFLQLAQYMENAANNLTASAKQTRTNDQDAADSLRS